MFKDIFQRNGQKNDVAEVPITIKIKTNHGKIERSNASQKHFNILAWQYQQQ